MPADLVTDTEAYVPRVIKRHSTRDEVEARRDGLLAFVAAGRPMNPLRPAISVAEFRS
jgi:hypothetical protein